MKILFTPASPYSRKALILCHELEIVDQVNIIDIGRTTPIETHASLSEINPIGKIPCLQLDDGRCLYDSRVICEYLDLTYGNGKFFPIDHQARWDAITDQALADGILDAAVNIRYETFLRPEEFRWGQWIEGQQVKYRKSLDQLNKTAQAFSARFDIGVVAIACALGYLDFRFSNENWRASRPDLAEWFESFQNRPSFVETAPN